MQIKPCQRRMQGTGVPVSVSAFEQALLRAASLDEIEKISPPRSYGSPLVIYVQIKFSLTYLSCGPSRACLVNFGESLFNCWTTRGGTSSLEHASHFTNWYGRPDA